MLHFLSISVLQCHIPKRRESNKSFDMTHCIPRTTYNNNCADVPNVNYWKILLVAINTIFNRKHNPGTRNYGYRDVWGPIWGNELWGEHLQGSHEKFKTKFRNFSTIFQDKNYQISRTLSGISDTIFKCKQIYMASSTPHSQPIPTTVLRYAVFLC